ncbi:unnamed protein product [Protopolystoma xenopodis]|uniref:Uncharacterized protein n=1 Tax=Protopolystoma xenopodis TaxID=117903 RepID=A0A3S5FC87_9PLAT|nr:unnamed protein product [Protopolystoma xenopodis]
MAFANFQPTCGQLVHAHGDRMSSSSSAQPAYGDSNSGTSAYPNRTSGAHRLMLDLLREKFSSLALDAQSAFSPDTPSLSPYEETKIASLQGPAGTWPSNFHARMNANNRFTLSSLWSPKRGKLSSI